jgi:hypothetical protein
MLFSFLLFSDKSLHSRKAPIFHYGRMARDGHGVPKVSPVSTMPNPSTSCAGQPINYLSRLIRPQGWRPAVVFYPFVHPTLYAYVFHLGIGMTGIIEMTRKIA